MVSSLAIPTTKSPSHALLDFRFNKPWAFYQWAANTTIKETTVVIMDPDQGFLAPVIKSLSYKMVELIPMTSARFLNQIHGFDQNHPARVAPGLAVAQTYGLGAGWVQPKMFDREKVCGAKSDCVKVNDEEAWQFYSVGMYLAGQFY
jgi:hypothetical protein